MIHEHDGCATVHENATQTLSKRRGNQEAIRGGEGVPEEAVHTAVELEHRAVGLLERIDLFEILLPLEAEIVVEERVVVVLKS